MIIGLSVLIIEDDAMIGLLLAEILDELGHKVCGTVATEEEAVAGAARLLPDLMLVDMNLKAGSGISAAERIRETHPIPCVFMSGTPALVGWANSTILRKPFAEHELVLAIAKVLGSGTHSQALPPGPPHVVPIR